MAALVQTIPQQSSAVPVLQTRPSSSSGAFTTSQSLQQTNSRNSAMSWNTYNTAGNSGSYRPGHQVVAPYAFTSTPNHSNSSNVQNRQSWSPSLRPEHRTSSAPSVPQLPANAALVGNHSRPVHYTAAGSVSTSSSNSSVQSHMSKDDTAIPSRQPRGDPSIRPLSTANLPSPTPPFMNISSPTVSRPSPDRYRRGNRRSDASAGARASPPILDENPQQTTSAGPTGAKSLMPDGKGHTRATSADDNSRSDKPQPELAKRYRRRSWGNMDNTGLINLELKLPVASPIPMPGGQDYFDQDRPRSAQSNREVSGSIQSARSSTSSVAEPGTVSPKPATKPEETKRTPKPSPLSQPVSADPTSPQTSQPTQREPPKLASPASQRLAELSRNDAHRPGKSRLRRAFSFGSASELLKASQNSHRKDGLSVDKSRRDILKEELGAEHAAIAEQQEASGLGESIYSHHQGRIFNSSTDNLSISSTASSASIMLRKMGKGMKRSTRSLVGLFRPKSVIASSPDDMAAQPMAPQVSVVNIEAERKGVAANADPTDLPHGGTVFPKVESTVLSASGKENDDAVQSRKSIVGGDRERAEVLAAVRKGILKKNNSDIALSAAAKSGTHTENGTDSPQSSTPSTPEEQPRTGIRRPDAVKIAGEDEIPETKNDSLGPPVASKSLVFSPRIQFHETWPSGEYDRRGDIATCNRLTPLLAQQIKEELNTFKMEMEVHETSKIYTHFL
ncbi:uncharacterized protein DSM5745_02028 [Aspergillus mulundensis]|uniref:Protein BNI4 n=1 Tax=Aspergillus mulundensis TaxID=1810919 RepID=A0A3D8SVA8_9EURO|nr:Uncharacterized protein DSM5745_02028 [Aspergillus mulundensis]RDW90253.1 Uncharacterized protein DSM5745_02028 [Aspergillus mulundensis]